MITDEQFNAAQAIIEQYHRERQQQAEWELEDEIYEDDEDDIEERRENERYEMALNCSCGAWIIGKSGNILHCADCICGAE